jgi:hypothetical protein
MNVKRAGVMFLTLIIVVTVLLGAANHMALAQGSRSSDEDLARKLDTVLSNQQAIMDELAAIKEELKIVKIRVTQSQ